MRKIHKSSRCGNHAAETVSYIQYGSVWDRANKPPRAGRVDKKSSPWPKPWAEFYLSVMSISVWSGKTLTRKWPPTCNGEQLQEMRGSKIQWNQRRWVEPRLSEWTLLKIRRKPRWHSNRSAPGWGPPRTSCAHTPLLCSCKFKGPWQYRKTHTPTQRAQCLSRIDKSAFWNWRLDKKTPTGA